MLGFFDFKPGRITDITGLDKALLLKGVHDLSLEIKVGDMLEKAQDDRSRCGYYILFAESVQELNERERRLKETVRVVTE